MIYIVQKVSALERKVRRQMKVLDKNIFGSSRYVAGSVAAELYALPPSATALKFVWTGVDQLQCFVILDR